VPFNQDNAVTAIAASTDEQVLLVIVGHFQNCAPTKPDSSTPCSAKMGEVKRAASGALASLPNN